MKQIFSILFVAFLITQFSCQGEANGSNDNTSSQNSDSLQNDSLTNLVDENHAWREKPFDNIEIPYQTFNYNAKTGLTFRTEAGSRIDIPANAFVDESGNPITKNIEVKYREFHDVGDIILSGIDMTYRDEKESGEFESAGMFEIRAFANNSELELAEDKKIKVDLASYKGGDFNDYFMNEETGKWEFLKQSTVGKNLLKEENVDRLEKGVEAIDLMCKNEPTEYKTGMEIFDLSYDLNRYGEYQFFHDAMWICVGDDKEKLELKKSLKGNNDMDITDADTCGNFTLSLFDRTSLGEVKTEKKFTMKPVWSGKAYERKKKSYHNELKQFKELKFELEKSRREADLWRSMELSGMGVYNCDRLIDYITFVTVSLAVIFKDKITSFFHITNNGKVAIKYYEPKFTEFKYNPNSTNTIIAVLPNGKVGKVNNEEMKSAYDNYVKSTDKNKKFEAEIIEQTEPVSDVKTFKNHVAKF